MKFKVLSSFAMGVLMLIIAFAGSRAPIRAQGTPEPEVTDNPCLSTQMATPEATPEDGAVAQDTPEAEATQTPCLATPEAPTEAQATPTPTAVVTETVSDGSIFIQDGNAMAPVIRIWVTWHDRSTGVLITNPPTYLAITDSEGIKITIPKNAVNIGIRIEQQYRTSQSFDFNPTCAFAFARPPKKQLIRVTNEGICIVESPFFSSE